MNKEQSLADKARRRFLGQSAAAAALTLTPGVTLMQVAQARPADQEATDAQRWGLLIDANKCAIGCDDCVKACNTENGLGEIHGPATDAQWIRKVSLRNKSTGRELSLPMMCQHCEHPPCVDVCPTGASMKRADGIVLVDKHICIGCRYCMMACPYKARNFVHETLTDQVPDVPRGKGTVESCTLCVHKIDRGDGTTACAEACKHNAIVFGDLKDPNSKISQALKQYPSTQIRADLELNTGVRYRGI